MYFLDTILYRDFGRTVPACLLRQPQSVMASFDIVYAERDFVYTNQMRYTNTGIARSVRISSGAESECHTKPTLQWIVQSGASRPPLTSLSVCTVSLE